MSKFTKALLARPIDLEIYRKTNPVGLTMLLYMTPWSISMPILLALIAWSCWGPK